MDTAEFKAGIERLLDLAKKKRTVLMCAEAVWWQCHRALISDWLKANGSTVFHILSATRCDEHPYTSAAQIIDGKLSYAAAGGQVEINFS